MSLRESYETAYAYGEAQVFDEYERNRELARTACRHIRPGEFGLDLGCNDEVVAEFLRSLGAEVVGLDFSTRALGFARTRGLKYLCLGDAEKTLPFGDRVFDYVFWGDNAEHLLAPWRLCARSGECFAREGSSLCRFRTWAGSSTALTIS